MAPSLACIEELKKISSFDTCIYIRSKEKARSADWLQALLSLGTKKDVCFDACIYIRLKEKARSADWLQALPVNMD